MQQTVRAPELESPLGWLNTDRPLRIAHELRGQIVILDFWTYCCINCIHILPDLKYLEAKYANEPFMVVGVHSAKFSNEGTRQTIRSAIHRYEIEHPVIVDDAMKLWRAYGARSWPTFVVIDPQGYVASHIAGEGHRETLDQTVVELLDRHREKGTLADGPVAFQRDAVVEPATGLAFPGKVLADRDSQRVFISDSNHNRIVVTSWPDANGRCERIKIIGGGQTGQTDGPADIATFGHPQGMALQGETLFVADTENHLIRAVNLSDWSVSTVIGTGEMGYDRAGGGMGVQQAISSPWDLAVEGGTLYIAMAGTHQIWRAEMPIGFARALAGSGRENIVDGPAEAAALSQPSGLCLHKGKLYVADSEVSAIREIDLAAECVTTIIGEGLFVFGDVDGDHRVSRLQHPLGVESWHDKLLLADTYNHKIKIVDPAARTVVSLYGTGSPGARTDDGLPAFYEPGGLDVCGDELFVADTNNHRVVRVDLKTHAWAELRIDGLVGAAAHRAGEEGEIITADTVTVSPDHPARISIRVDLPSQSHLNGEAPWTIQVVRDGTILAQETGIGGDWPLEVIVAPGILPESGVVDVHIGFVYCTDGDEGLCIPGQLAWRVALEKGEGSNEIALTAAISPPNVQNIEPAKPAPAKRVAFTRCRPVLKTNDIRSTLEFYVKILGFQATALRPSDDPTFCTLDQGLASITFDAVLDDSPAFSGQIAFEVGDVRALYDSIKDRVKIVRGLSTSHDGRREFTCLDPNGYVLAFHGAASTPTAKP